MATPTDRSLRMELVFRVELPSLSSGRSCFTGPRMELVLRVELLLGPRGGAAPVSSVWISLHLEGSVGVVPLCSPGVAELWSVICGLS